MTKAFTEVIKTGYGSYTSNDWTKLRKSKGLNKSCKVENVFVNKVPPLKYGCRNISRQSRDSMDSPQSTPIIIGFDVTSSMGFLAKELAVNSLNKTILSLYEQHPVSYPHILCSAIGDCKSDCSPLQVTQFEADIRIIKQLTDLYIEGGGGGNSGESYNLLWYFAARHTVTDCFEKRRKKGFLFTIGDDLCHEGLNVSEIDRVFGDKVPYSLSNTELLKEAEERYHVFHIHIETENSVDKKFFSVWQRLMPGKATTIRRNDTEYLPELITSIIGMTEGMKLKDILNSLETSSSVKIMEPLALITIQNKQNNTITF